jgi:ubiquinone/menaquinone biosynthesis C-methylase UbiE
MNPDPISSHARAHLEKIRGHYDQSGELTKAATDYRKMLASVYSSFIPESASVLEVGCGAGDLLVHLHGRRRTGVDVSAARIQAAQQKMPEAEFFVQAGEELALPGRSFDYLILSETINLAADVQRLFERLRLVSHRGTRLIINVHSALWRPMIWAGTALGLRNRQPESNWLSKEDIGGLLHLTGRFRPLFGASKLNLKILDIPIRYRERVYGQTNIHRWRHGWLLLRMVAFAALKLKFV